MTGLPEHVARAFEGHGAFERAGEATFEATTTPFEAAVRVRVRADADERDAEERAGVACDVSVRAPMLSAAVVGEEVAPVVEEGWFETFERRMEDAHMALSGDVEPTVGVDGEEAVVRATVTGGRPEAAAEDARAFVEYVEGTYVEGIIPGYEYAEPVAGLRRRARHTGDDGAA